jgi:hypothetical protein
MEVEDVAKRLLQKNERRQSLAKYIQANPNNAANEYWEWLDVKDEIASLEFKLTPPDGGRSFRD